MSTPRREFRDGEDDTSASFDGYPLSTYLQCPGSGNFTDRLAGHISIAPYDEKASAGSQMPGRTFSSHTSVLVHASSEYASDSMDLDSAPPLTRGNSDASSMSGLGTDTVSVIEGGAVMQSLDGILYQPERPEARADLLCPFQVLDCGRLFHSECDFKSHVFTHFRGHQLPPFAPCFLCRYTWMQDPAGDPADPWNDMLTHMVRDHFRAGQEYGVFRADVALMRYMWNKKIITVAELKRCQLIAQPISLPGSANAPFQTNQIPEDPMTPSATSPPRGQNHLNQSMPQSIGAADEPYAVIAGRRAERRQRDATSLRARTRGHL